MVRLLLCLVGLAVLYPSSYGLYIEGQEPVTQTDANGEPIMMIMSMTGAVSDQPREKPTSLCKPGVPVVNCLVSPCLSNPCGAGKTCQEDYCGGCNYKCLPGPKKADIKGHCKDGKELVKCKLDPCDAIRCKGGFKCQVDRCGECTGSCVPDTKVGEHGKPSNTIKANDQKEPKANTKGTGGHSKPNSSTVPPTAVGKPKAAHLNSTAHAKPANHTKPASRDKTQQGFLKGTGHLKPNNGTKPLKTIGTAHSKPANLTKPSLADKPKNEVVGPRHSKALNQTRLAGYTEPVNLTKEAAQPKAGAEIKGASGHVPGGKSKPCEAGYYTLREGRISLCKKCPPGFWSDANTALGDKCKPCGSGTYASTFGSVACTVCPFGFTTGGRIAETSCKVKASAGTVTIG